MTPLLEKLKSMRTRKKAVVLLLLLCISLLSSAGLARAQLEAPSAPEIYSVRFPSLNMLAPARVVLTYTYTKSYSVNVTDFGQTLHQEISSPTSMEFDTSAVDIYNITFTVNYDMWVNQTVTIELFENQTGAAKVMELDMESKGFTINMVISTSTPPTYPSTDQIVNGIKDYFANQINLMQSSNNSLVNSIMIAVIFSAVIAPISLGISLAAMILLIRSATKKARVNSILKQKPEGERT